MGREFILHHGDLDGYCSAVIMMNYLTDKKVGGGVVSRTRRFDYKDEFPIGEIHEDDQVYLLDVTPKVDDFELLVKKVGSDSIVWIDHHRRNTDPVLKVLGKGVPIRRVLADTYPSAAMLTWQHTHDGVLEPPKVVEYVDRWDTWRHENHSEILDFVWGAKFRGLEDDVEGWFKLLDERDGAERELSLITDTGRDIRDFDVEQMGRRLDHHGFDVKVPMFSGALLKGRALNCGLINSFAFTAYEGRGYDVWVSFYFDGIQYTVSLYRARESLDADLGQYCSQMGGGGHKGAAGFQCKRLPEWLHA